MKKISLKLKLTLLYTFFMALLTCASLAILFSLSNREVLSSTQSKLENRVQESVEYIALRNGEIRIDSDFYSVARDVYLSLYDSDMYFLYGRVPHGFSQQPELADGEIRTIQDGNREWYVYDMSYRLSEERTVYVRGITSITDAEESFTVTVRFALIILPLMVLATAVIGYRFTRRTLAPVRQITDTVRQIRADADLSRRIGFADEGNDKGKDRDEIYVLGKTFDEMLGELESVFRREQQFTSDASHELRTPVSVILAQCDAMLAEENAFTEEQRSQLVLIQRKAKGMADMISQLLFLSRADQGRQPLHKERVNVSELTEMIAEEQQILADADGRGIQVETEITPDIWMEVIRDMILFRENKLLLGFVAILISAFVCNLVLTMMTNTVYFNPGFAAQPIAHTDGLWNFLGMFLAGFGCVLLGGCPLRQLVLSGEGNTDSAITVIGLIIGAAFAHNFGLASSGEGPTDNGKIAVIIGIVVITVIAWVNTMQAKKTVKEILT